MEENKVLLILVDGMRSDSLDACGHPYVAALRRESVSTPRARSVVPPVTLPCHMSLFHSVPPARHGVTTNVYVPQVRPLEGLCDYLARFGRRCAMFYSWEQLRDLSRPASLSASLFLSGKDLGYGPATGPLVKSAMETMAQLAPDFVFLYLGEPDEVGHNEGWMSPAYLRSVRSAWDSIQQVLEQLPPSYTALVTADHGGHDRTHGVDCPEDMTIPLFLRGGPFAPGAAAEDVVSLLDIAPTVAALLGLPPAKGWEGRCLV